MSFVDVQHKTTITGFSSADEATILAAMRTAYEGSDYARVMMDKWIMPSEDFSDGRQIFITPGDPAAYAGTGKVRFDVNFMDHCLYIDNNGKAVKNTVLGGIVHELVHALTGKLDDGTGAGWADKGDPTEYRGGTVVYSNNIFKQLGLPEMNSYIGQNVLGIGNDVLIPDFQYTNGAKIDRSVVVSNTYAPGKTEGTSDWDSSEAGSSNDLLIGDERENKLKAGDGNDFLYGNGGKDTLDGGNGDDLLVGGSGTDTLDGGNGDDILLGGVDPDNLKGGDGNDLLLGGDGMDTYAFSGAFGTDIVADSDGLGRLQVDGQALSGAGQQKLQDVYQDVKSDYTYLKVDGGKRLVILKKDGDGRILVKDWPAQGALGINLSGDVAAAPEVTLGGDFRKKINDKGTPKTSDDFYVMTGDNYTPDGNESGALDLISGTAGADVIDGKGGDDALSGGSGDDWILGGVGCDQIQGGMGRDTIYGGDGDDSIWASSDVYLNKPLEVDRPNVVNFIPHPQGTGFNWISGYYETTSNGVPYSWGNAPRDRLDNDEEGIVDGGAGNDFILAGTGSDFVRGGADKDYILGMDGDDVIFGNEDNDFIFGDGNQPGNDSAAWTLFEKHGDDVIDGGTGDDYLVGQGGSDIIFGGIDNDVIWGDEEEETLPLHYHGDDFLFGGKGNDLISAGGGNDYLEGGMGNDTIWGMTGDDVYYFNVGDGIDTLIDNKGEINILRFGAGVDSSKIKLSLGSLLLDLGNGDAIHIDGFSQNDVFNSSSINRFEFADGGALTLAELLERGFDLTGAAGNDLLLGTNTVDRIEGLEGDDILDGGAGDDRLGGGSEDDELYGGEGNDYLSGGIGTDRLEGGSGDDTYYFEAGDGSVSLSGLVEGIADEGGSDTVWFGGSISSNDVKLSKSAVEGYLSVDYNGGQDSLAIKNGIEGAVEFFRFGDKTFSWEELASVRGIAIDGTAGNDDLSGSRFQDRITGGTGDDILA
ncbi:hypothetical protein FDZ73_18950, partial [bacterium]